MRTLTINIMATYEDDEEFAEDCAVDIEFDGEINERHLVGEVARAIHDLANKQNNKIKDVTVCW